MRIAITGASGLIGSHLVPALRGEGHEVLTLVRRAPTRPDEVQWDPAASHVDTDGLVGVEGVVHLAGAGLGDHRWTAAYKREIRDSRVRGTATIATALASLDPLPKVLVSASAVGWYGDTGEREVDEDSAQGTGFLADVCEQWERAADPARRAGIRVVHPRIGLVLSPDGGAWARMLPLFRLGVGGRLGDGRQYWSFIALDDVVRAMTRLLTDPSLSGPVNLTAPNPVTNAQATHAMGRALHRPTVLPVPSLALKAVLGEFASDVLTGQRVLPRRLSDAGFVFAHPRIEDALDAVA